MDFVSEDQALSLLRKQASGVAPSADPSVASLQLGFARPGREMRVPTEVEVVGLQSKPELNGRLGHVKKYDEAKLRVGVEFAAPFGLLSLKHTNIEMADGGEERAGMLLQKYERSKGKKKALAA